MCQRNFNYALKKKNSKKKKWEIHILKSHLVIFCATIQYEMNKYNDDTSTSCRLVCM